MANSCKQCGGEILPNMRFCRFCGAPTGWPLESAETQPFQPNAPTQPHAPTPTQPRAPTPTQERTLPATQPAYLSPDPTVSSATALIGPARKRLWPWVVGPIVGLMLVVLAFLISDYRERQRQSIHISEGEQGIEITEGDKKIIIPKEQPPPPPPPVEELAPSRKLPPAAPSSPVKKPSPGMEAPAPPPPSVGQPQQQVRRVSTQVLYANAVHRVHPEWPPFARRSGWVPPVEVQVVVDENGTVTSAEAISGPLPLQPAAVDAARQWKFQPFMLDGEPTPMTGLLVFGGRIRRFERFHLQ